MASDVAGRYAEALFELSKEEDTVEERKEEAQVLREVLKRDPELLTFFRAVKVTDEEKKDAIDSIFASCLPSTRNFLKLLIDKDRTFYLDEILKEYIRLANLELGIETAVVSSARPLDETQMERIRQALEIKTGHRIQLVNTIDKSLIAGIKVTAGNTVTDVTLARQIEGMKEALLKGGNA
ncbi:MAG: ATP synthase F1 subunit delta [Solobacterium sp.]|nr:ATP synthase F1 subunit delta [Solobacterium sp.]